MLTKQDLKNALLPLLEKITDLEDKLDNTNEDITESSFRIRAEIQQEMKSVKRNLREIRQNQKLFYNFLDENLQQTRKKVDRIEDVLKLPSLSS